MAEPDTPNDKVYHSAEEWHFPRGLSINTDQFSINGAPAMGDELMGDIQNAGISAFSRMLTNSSLAPTTQQLVLSYFKAPKNAPAVQQRYYCTTAAGATPSLVRFALFSVDANGDLTRIAITPNDTALFSAANAAATKAYSAAAAVIAGQLYAAGRLIVSAAAFPPIICNGGQPTVGELIMGTAPRLSGVIAAQADIAASYTAAQVANYNRREYCEILAA